MAEVIGVVASGISIVQIAGQVANSVLKIKIFWDRVKIAPDEINHLLREVESFSLVLQHIRDDLAHNSLPELVFDNDCMRQSLELCKSGASELERLASDLTAKLEGKTGVLMKMSAVRIVLKNDDIKSSKRRLKSAIRLLSLAYQCHTSAMIRLQPEIILARLSAAMAASADQRIVDADCQTASTEKRVVQNSTSDSTSLVTQCYTLWTRSPSWLSFLFGSLEYNRRNVRRRGREHDLRKARYKLPELISSRTWDFTYYASLSDWSVNIRTYRTLGHDASIIEAIWKGDILRVQDLLCSKEAFVTDRDKGGDTLLHAVTSGCVEICKLLILEGADVCLPNNYSRTPLEYLTSWVIFKGNYGDKHRTDEIAHLLVEAGACEGLNNETDALQHFQGGTVTFKYLQQQICCQYYDLPLSKRMEIAFGLNNGFFNKGCYFEPEMLKLAITSSRIDEDMATFVSEKGITFLHDVAICFARFYYLCLSKSLRFFDVMEVVSKEYRMLIGEVVGAGACLHAVSDGNSILRTVILESFCNLFSAKTVDIYSLGVKIIKLWLFELEQAGVDLAQYGADEHTLLDSGNVLNTYIFFTKNMLFLETHLINFLYGSHPEDWTFWFSEATDLFAGEFWEMVEHIEESDELELPIPGSWINNS